MPAAREISTTQTNLETLTSVVTHIHRDKKRIFCESNLKEMIILLSYARRQNPTTLSRPEPRTFPSIFLSFFSDTIQSRVALVLCNMPGLVRRILRCQTTTGLPSRVPHAVSDRVVASPRHLSHVPNPRFLSSSSDRAANATIRHAYAAANRSLVGECSHSRSTD